MSIQDEIKAHTNAGTLLPYLPRNPYCKAKRRLYLGCAAIADLGDPNSATNLLVGKAYIISAFERWTKGERVHGQKRGEFLCRLDPPPPEIWEIRVTEPRPQARLFGRFAEPDTLIITKFHTRNYLKDRGSQAWNEAMNKCDADWQSLFPQHQPFSAPTIGEYVTENCDDFPI